MGENSTAVGFLNATDPDDEDDVTGCALSGADAGKLSITSDGVISFATAPDYEDPDDVNGDNVYQFTVTVTSGSGDRELTAIQGYTIAVTNVAEAPEFDAAPYAFTVVEGSVEVVSVTATDPDGDAIVNYVKQGDDGPRFELVKENGVKTGELVFRETPDYDDPDDDGDNVYQFTIQAVSGQGDARRSATVEVTVTVVAEEQESGRESGSEGGSGAVDPPAPHAVESVALSGSRSVGENEPYVEDDVLTITVTFDADVAVSGTPQFKLQVGAPARTKARLVDCAAEEGVAHVLTCAYTVQSEETDRDGNGVSYPQNALILPEGAAITHRDDVSVTADLTLAAMPHNCTFIVNKVGTCAQ